MTMQENDAFRIAVRSFIRAALPEDLAARGRQGFHSGREDQERWGRILHAKGWSAPRWPTEWGGCGWSPHQLQIFGEECFLAGAPDLSWNGIRLVGPVIFNFGSEALRRRFLPPTLSWDLFWGQGFSEPDAGSDLASLRTQARRDGQDYVVNGSKIWMTDGHFADWLFCLVRTDQAAKKQEGISFLLIDARSPGVEMRPIPTIDGQHTLNQVFFTDVRVPIDNLVGEEGSGWTYAKFLLANERSSSAEVPRCKFYLQRLFDIAQCVRRNGRLIGEDACFREQLARVEVELLALEQAALALMDGDNAPEAFMRASVLKLKGAHLLQAMSELMVDAIGADSILFVAPSQSGDENGVPPHVPGVTADFLYRRAATIYGGSAEIQRTIIASGLLGAAV